jgi:hypothetical protein
MVLLAVSLIRIITFHDDNRDDLVIRARFIAARKNGQNENVEGKQKVNRFHESKIAEKLRS